jgi:tRNA pseudouridine55 synthase
MPQPTPPSPTTAGTDGLVDGLALVDKPAGVSSHDVVNAARRAFGEKRIGHGGTLDPFATGLLVLLVGRATRLLPHIPAEPKVYEATIRFGAETDTEDLLGAVTREAPLPTRGAMLEALPALCGRVLQVPPAYSAKRIDGKRAYDLARRGEAVELAPVEITVHRWEVLGITEDEAGGDTADAMRVREARVRITCAGGTYVRSLARDLARACGSAAHLTVLRRLRSGPFDVADAVTLEQLRDRTAELRPALDALPGLPRQALDAEDIARIVRGIDVAVAPDPVAPDAVAGAAAVATSDAPQWGALTHVDSGALVALAERRPSERGVRWQPRVVMREA